jgi:hypothetical protein
VYRGIIRRFNEASNAYRILVGKPEGKRPLGRPRRRWVDNIKMDLREIEWDGIVACSLVKRQVISEFGFDNSVYLELSPCGAANDYLSLTDYRNNNTS